MKCQKCRCQAGLKRSSLWNRDFRGDFLREIDLERQVVREIKRMGGLALKFISPGNAGVPDRIILLNGRICFAEIKAPGKKLRNLQRHWKQRLERLGFRVYVIDSKESMELMLDEICTPRLPDNSSGLDSE